MVAAGFEVSDDLRTDVERRLLYALSRFGAGVERVVVRLSDATNPLGGVDRHCQMRAWLRRHDSVRVETLDGPLAIERAVERLAERVDWVLVNGHAETDLRLTSRALRPKPEEGAASGPPRARRARRLAGTRPASRRGPRSEMPRRRTGEGAS